MPAHNIIDKKIEHCFGSVVVASPHPKYVTRESINKRMNDNLVMNKICKDSRIRNAHDGFKKELRTVLAVMVHK